VPHLTIDNINIHFSPQQNGPIGFASFILNNSIKLSSIGIWRSNDENGFRITYPTKGHKDLEIFHPIDKPTHEQILNAIISKIREYSNGLY
jgi:DNA-binding cell septation regulator SpoVG